MTTTANSAVFARIEKLYALANGRGATEAEATLAAEHVQRLLQEHNLSLSDLEARSGAQDDTRAKVDTRHRAMYEYQVTLMRALARSNFCLHVISKAWQPQEAAPINTKTARHYGERGRWSRRHTLVGRAVNVQSTLMSYEYLLKAVHRICVDSGYDHRTRDGKAFIEGAASRLEDRLDVKRREREQEDAARAAAMPSQGNGSHRELVLSDVYGSEADLNNDKLNNLPPGTTASHRREHVEREARRKAEQERLVAEGVDPDVAFYRAHGYDETRAVEAVKRWKRQSGRSGRGWSRRWTNGDSFHAKKVNSAAYKAGRSRANDIGLDSQVGRSDQRQITKA